MGLIMDNKTSPAACFQGSDACRRIESGLNYEGPHFAGSTGHPNSWVAANRSKMLHGNISYDRDPQKDRFSRIGRFDGVTAIVGQMRSYPMNERVQRMGCCSLAEISFHNWDYTVKAAVSRGAAAVLAAMQNHPDSEGLQQWSCAALACMSQGSELGRRIVVAEGGAQAVANALARFPRNEAIQNWGSEMMENAHFHTDGTSHGPLEGPGRSYGSVLAQARQRQANKALGGL